MVVPALAGYYLFGLGGPAATADGHRPGGIARRPGRHVRLVRGRRGRRPTRRRADHARRPRTVPARVAEGIDVELPARPFRDHARRRRPPDALELTVDGTDAHYTETVDFSDWGADIAIGVPEGEIDETPWLDEEALAEVRGIVHGSGAHGGARRAGRSPSIDAHPPRMRGVR